jgi:hypothetical protein
MGIAYAFFVFTIIFHNKKTYFLKQIKYVELTCFLGGSALSWSAVLVVFIIVIYYLSYFVIFFRVYRIYSHKGVSTLSWWWGSHGSGTWRAIPEVV